MKTELNVKTQTNKESYLEKISLTVRLLEPGHLEENCPITKISKNKRFSRFRASETITFIYLRTVS